MNDVLLQRISDLLDADNLSTWETDFLESIQIQARSGKDLTDRQMDKLEEIEDRHA